MKPALLRCRQLVQVYRVGSSEVIALQGLDLDVHEGELVGVIGSSGSGKSTLLSIISGLLRPTGGHVGFGSLELGQAGMADLDRYRRVDVGFLWQDSASNLVPYLSARDNIALRLSDLSGSAARKRSDALLGRVGLSDRRGHKPAELSGGEQQRVAFAVAIAHEPRLLLADEPTGELDGATTEQMFELMREIGEETNLTQIIVSHDPAVAQHVDRVIAIRDGRVAAEQRMGRTADGSSAIVEVTMLDSLGRLQLSEEQRHAVGRTGRVHTELVDGELHIRPAYVTEAGAEGTGQDDE